MIFWPSAISFAGLLFADRRTADRPFAPVQNPEPEMYIPGLDQLKAEAFPFTETLPFVLGTLCAGLFELSPMPLRRGTSLCGTSAVRHHRVPKAEGYHICEYSIE